MADALREALPQPARAPPREQHEAGDDTAGQRRGGLLRPRVYQGRAVHCATDEERYENRAHKHGE